MLKRTLHKERLLGCKQTKCLDLLCMRLVAKNPRQLMYDDDDVFIKLSALLCG